MPDILLEPFRTRLREEVIGRVGSGASDERRQRITREVDLAVLAVVGVLIRECDEAGIAERIWKKLQASESGGQEANISFLLGEEKMNLIKVSLQSHSKLKWESMEIITETVGNSLVKWIGNEEQLSNADHFSGWLSLLRMEVITQLPKALSQSLGLLGPVSDETAPAQASSFVSETAVDPGNESIMKSLLSLGVMAFLGWFAISGLKTCSQPSAKTTQPETTTSEVESPEPAAE